MGLIRNKKLKKLPIIYYKDPCPKCGCEDIADIQISQFTSFENNKISKSNFQHDLPVIFITPAEYKNYYSLYHLNSRCLNCRYEFYSKTHRINRKDLYSDNEINQPVEQKFDNSEQDKKESKLKRIFKILKE